jgi:3'-5' exoribonuclease
MSSKRVPIADLSDAVQVEQAFRVADKQLRVNRQGGKYILLRLEDRSGVIAAMMWNADERVFDRFDRSDFVHCCGRTQIHNGALQLIVTSIERMDAAEVDLADFERFDHLKSEGHLDRLREILLGLEDPALKAIGKAFLDDHVFVEAFRRAPAAISHHHAYPGGLLQHTLDLMELAALISVRYSEVNKDLLIAGAFLHDLGKISEMSDSGEATYSDRGQLVGHIVIGVQMLGQKIEEVHKHSAGLVSDDTRYHLEHLIVSHHGLMEYGSPRIPVTLEALVLHHLDNLDAKLASYLNVLETDVSVGGNWTNYSPSIGRKLWRR